MDAHTMLEENCHHVFEFTAGSNLMKRFRSYGYEVHIIVWGRGMVSVFARKLGLLEDHILAWMLACLD